MNWLKGEKTLLLEKQKKDMVRAVQLAIICQSSHTFFYELMPVFDERATGIIRPLWEALHELA